jgi:hypothetical protein
VHLLLINLIFNYFNIMNWYGMYPPTNTYSLCPILIGGIIMELQLGYSYTCLVFFYLDVICISDFYVNLNGLLTIECL